MKNYILDSSIVLEMLLTEDKKCRNEILAIVENNNAFSSEFLKLEVSNVLASRIKNNQVVEDLYKKFLNLPIEYLQLTELVLFLARQVSIDLAVSVYDASYHVLASQNNFIFLTFDRKYYLKAKSLGNIELFE